MSYLLYIYFDFDLPLKITGLSVKYYNNIIIKFVYYNIEQIYFPFIYYKN